MGSQPPREWHDFVPLLLREHQARTVVEVGVWKAQLSEAILAHCVSVEQLTCVDPWEVCYGQRDTGQWVVLAPGVSRAEMDDAYRTTRYKLGPYKDRVRIWRLKSVQAAERFADNVLDAVIIDALHFANFVIEDIRAWLPKLRPGGLMIGDDLGTYYPGVEVGVREVFGDNYKVWGASNKATWWTYKEAACSVRA